MAGSVSHQEVARFDALAGRWWDPAGPMAPLHAMNGLRVGWITDRIRALHPQFAGLRLLDVGCGAGLASEAFARAGLDVTGIDAAGEAIAAARAHAAGQDLRLDYREAAPEDLTVEGELFDVVVALEVIEHVPDPAYFVATLAALLAPDGLLFLSTLNRTVLSLLTAKIGAEYVARLLPRGTHDWRKFVKPGDLARDLRAAGLRVADSAGMVFDPVRGRWRSSASHAVNYIVMAVG